MDPPETITPIEISRKYGYGIRVIRAWAKDGRLPGRIIDGSKNIRFRADCVELWFTRATKAGTSAADLVRQFEDFHIAELAKKKSDKSARLAQAREDFAGRNQHEDNDSR